MNKQLRLSRLGAFELLEERALLAHAAPPGMFRDESVGREFDGWELRGEAHAEMHTRDIAAPASGNFASHGRSRGPQGGYFDGNSAIALQPVAAAPPVFFVTAPVIIFVTLPPPVVSSTFSEPLTSTSRTPEPTTHFASLRSPTSNPSASSTSPSATSSTASRGTASTGQSLGSLSAIPALSLTPTAKADNAGDDEAAPLKNVDDESQDVQERPSQTIETPSPTQEIAIRVAADDDSAELIELDPEELLKRSKRKAARTASSPVTIDPTSARVNETAINRLPRIEQQPAERWLTPAEVDEACALVSDDLIELQAVDQLTTQRVRSESIPFTAIAPDLEARLGFHQAEFFAVENAAVDPIAAPQAPAAAQLQAAALPVRTAQ